MFQSHGIQVYQNSFLEICTIKIEISILLLKVEYQSIRMFAETNIIKFVFLLFRSIADLPIEQTK